MATVRYVEHTEIAAPIERVYDYRFDFTTLPAYNPSVSNLRAVGDGEYVFDLEVMGSIIESPLRVVEAERPSRIVIVTGPGFIARETCMFSETDAGTYVVFDTTLSFDGDVDRTTAETLAEQGSRQVRVELENLKDILEGES